jgi:hypothetical protein
MYHQEACNREHARGIKIYIFLYFKNIFKKTYFFIFFLYTNIKIIFLKILKKYYFNIFLNKKQFKIQPLPYNNNNDSKIHHLIASSGPSIYYQLQEFY